MARRIQQIELVSFSVPGLVENGDGVGLDGDALFPLQIHGVQKLILLLPFGMVFVFSSNRSERVVFPWSM